MDSKDVANEGIEIARRIAPQLAGLNTDIVGVALADLLSIWLAGHVVVGNVAETAKMREVILAKHIDTVRSLILVNEMMLEERAAKKELAAEHAKNH